MSSYAAPPFDAKTSNQAIWSLVLGILSCTCLWALGSIPAIILGVLAIKSVDQSSGRLKGRGLGIAGIVTGSVGILAGLIPISILASIVVPVTSKVQEKAFLVKEISNARQIMLATRSYASDYEGNFPPDLETLVEEGYLDDESQIQWQKDPVAPGQPYRYRAGLNDTASPKTIVIAAPDSIAGKVVVGYVSGEVQAVPEAAFEWPEEPAAP